MFARRLLPALLAALLAACGEPAKVSPPVLALSASQLDFAGVVQGAAPAAQQVTVSNAGGGSLGTPTVDIGYGDGSGWLAATLTGTAAPFTLTLQPSLVGLAAGTYLATVRVASVSSAGPAQAVSVTLVVAPRPVTPALALSASAVEFRTATPGAAAPPQVVTAASSTSAPLAAPPTTATSYAAGGPSGWLTVSVTGAAAPYDLTFTADSTGLPLGLATATVEVAAAGADGSPRTVAVTLWVGRVVEARRLLTLWAEDGTTQEVSDPILAELTLLQDGPGGATRTVAQPGLVQGSWLALAAPGAYWIELRLTGGVLVRVQGDVDLLDLGMDLGGRLLRAPATAPTQVTLNLDGLEAWATGDLLRLTSWGAQAADELDPGFGQGDQQASFTFNWASTMGWLLAPSDVLHVGQYRYNAAESNTAFSYLEARATTSVTGLTLVSGTPLDVTPPFAEVPALVSLVVDWRRDAMEAAAAPFVPSAAGLAHRYGVYAIPAPLTAPSPLGARAVTVLESTDAALSGDIAVADATVGRFLPAPAWREYQEASFAVPVNRVATGATTPLAGAADFVLSRVDASVVGVAGPIVGAPAAPVVDGIDALLPGTLGSLTPTLSWSLATSPAGASPTNHVVGIFELTAVGTATRASPVVELVLQGTSVQLPAGVLQAGKQYLIRIAARSSPAGAAAPYRTGVPEGRAAIWTAVFTTAP